MNETGFWESMFDVASGRGRLRLVLQPLIAIVLGVRLGVADAKEARDPFVLRLFTSTERRRLAREAVLDVIVPFTIAVVIDGILQYMMRGYVRPVAAIVMGMLLIWLPFSIARALSNRFYRRTRRGRSALSPT